MTMDINSTIQAIITPMIDTTQSVISSMRIIFGGIIGLYILLVLLRWHEIRSLKRLFGEMKLELKVLNESVQKLQRQMQRKKK